MKEAAPQDFSVQYLEPPVALDAEPMPGHFSSSRLRRSLLGLGAVVLLVVAALVLLPGLGSLRSDLAGAKGSWLVLAAVLQILSCASYVLVFRAVFCRRMSWRTSAEIGFSELAANSLFSFGGTGGLALGAWIMRRGGLAGDHVARRSVAFFLLTSLTNVALLAVGGVALATGALPGARSPWFGAVPAVVALLGIALALVAGRGASALAGGARRARVAAVARAVGDGVAEALELLREGDPALILGALGYLLFDIAMLGVCFVAFGNDVPPLGVLVVAYIIGQLGGLIPIPGGIGGVDGGLIGTLALYGVGPGDAAVAVIAYRGLLLAIPAVLGLPALAILRRRLHAEP